MSCDVARQGCFWRDGTGSRRSPSCSGRWRLRGGAACDGAELGAGVRERAPDRVARGGARRSPGSSRCSARSSRCRTSSRRSTSSTSSGTSSSPGSSSSGSTTARATGFRSFRDGFLAATAIALVIHWLYPTAPPRLAGVGIEDTLLVLSGIDIGSPTSSALSNPVAAVPSLHAAYALGVGIGLIRYAPLASGPRSRARSTRRSSCSRSSSPATTSCSTPSPGWPCSASASARRERFGAGTGEQHEPAPPERASAASRKLEPSLQ